MSVSLLMHLLYFSLIEHAALPFTKIHPGQICSVKGADLPEFPDFGQRISRLHPVIEPTLRMMPHTSLSSTDTHP